MLSSNFFSVNLWSFNFPWHKWMMQHTIWLFFSFCVLALQLDDRTLQNLVLLEIEQLLQANQRSLTDYPSMPYPEDANCPTYLDNSLILAELNYNNEELISKFEHLFSQMTGILTTEQFMPMKIIMSISFLAFLIYKLVLQLDSFFFKSNTTYR